MENTKNEVLKTKRKEVDAMRLLQSLAASSDDHRLRSIYIGESTACAATYNSMVIMPSPDNLIRYAGKMVYVGDALFKKNSNDTREVEIDKMGNPRFRHGFTEVMREEGNKNRIVINSTILKKILDNVPLDMPLEIIVGGNTEGVSIASLSDEDFPFIGIVMPMHITMVEERGGFYRPDEEDLNKGGE